MNERILSRNHVVVNPAAEGGQWPPVVFAHGFGCDQRMWRFVEPSFRPRSDTIVFDYVGSGRSDQQAYDRTRYSTLEGYATDLLEVLAATDVTSATVIGHSVSAMIAAIAVNRDPSRIGRIVMIGPSPCYINDGDYKGGFERQDIEELLELMDSNYIGWAQSMAPMVMKNPEQPELADELEQSFCSTDPLVARQFAEATFLSDCRDQLAEIPVPTLVLQCSADTIAPDCVGPYVAQQIPHADLKILKATGHCPHMSHPQETSEAILAWLDR